MSPNKNKKPGFTLIELLIVLVLIGGLVGLAAPTFRGYQHRQAVQNTLNDLAADLTMAYSEARSKSRMIRVLMVPGIDGKVLSYQVDSCEPGGALVCDLDQRDTILLPPGVMIIYGTGDLDIRFQPPYGEVEILLDGSTWGDAVNESYLDLQVKNHLSERILRLHAVSGLIEKRP